MSFATIHRVSRLFDMPEFVKSAEYYDADALRGLPSTSFADPRDRRYPVHTKAATWLSNASFWEKALFEPNPDESTGRNLLKAAGFWGIERDVKGVIDKVAAQHAQYTGELPDQCYALVFEHEDRKYRYFPIVDDRTVKQAAADLSATRHKFPLSLRKQAAQRLISRAMNLMTDLPDEARYAFRAAGYGTCSREKMAAAFDARVPLLRIEKHHELAAQCQKIAKDLRDRDYHAPDKQLVAKTAGVLDEIDRQAGLWKYYGQHLELPEEQLYHPVTKTASADDDDRVVALTTGSVVTRDELKRYAPAALTVLPEYHSELVGVDGELDAEKAAEVLPTMPRPDAVLFEQALMAEKRAAGPFDSGHQLTAGAPSTRPTPAALTPNAPGVAGMAAARPLAAPTAPPGVKPMHATSAAATVKAAESLPGMSVRSTRELMGRPLMPGASVKINGGKPPTAAPAGAAGLPVPSTPPTPQVSPPMPMPPQQAATGVQAHVPGVTPVIR
jgi:hypothetical protein